MFVDSSFLGGNARIISIGGEAVTLDVELRDTVGDWFFWCFRVGDAKGKTIRFEFSSDVRVGYYGAAVSRDRESWEWQYSEPTHAGSSFTYTFADDGVYYFAHDMVYSPSRFFAFAEKRGLSVKTLCLSEGGREVPYIDTEEGEECILLAARHHACESTGNYVLEGVLEEMILRFASKYRIICIPFVDYDGVTEGDQGKGRAGHDHNRDYVRGVDAVYHSVSRIREFADCMRIRYAFDFHSPWHLGGVNDTVFIPIKHFSILENIRCFSRFFEEETAEGGLPHFAHHDVLPNDGWNTFGTPCFGTYMGEAGAELSFTLETAYFSASGIPFSPERARKTGHAFVRALQRYEEYRLCRRNFFV